MKSLMECIELRIVLVIADILAVIAIPAYQDYITKSQANAGYSEISSLNTGSENAVTDAITCTLKGNPKNATTVISLSRSADGAWSCLTTIPAADDKFIPKGCANGTAAAGSISTL